MKLNTKVELEKAFDLDDIEEIYLQGNLEKVEIPSGVWSKVKTLSLKLPKLKILDSALFHLPQLVNLKIIDTPIERLILPLGQINSPLKSFTLKNCQIEYLPEEISQFTELMELNISQNSLQKLPESFVFLKKLKRLNLDSNKFQIFPDFIKKMPSLHHLSIDENLFSEEEKERIQREFHITPV